jgi:molybdopterin adenylyltransferase
MKGGDAGDADEPHGDGPSLPKAKVLTVSDGVASGHREDRSGAALVSLLTSSGFDVVETAVVADGVVSVAGALTRMASGFSGVVVSTGGTGFAPRDQTPEGTKEVIDRDAPGLAEAMRLCSPLGRLSRAVAGIKGQAIIINTPGSPRGAAECLGAVIDVLPHALELLGDKPTQHL